MSSWHSAARNSSVYWVKLSLNHFVARKSFFTSDLNIWSLLFAAWNTVQFHPLFIQQQLLTYLSTVGGRQKCFWYPRSWLELDKRIKMFTFHLNIYTFLIFLMWLLVSGHFQLLNARLCSNVAGDKILFPFRGCWVLHHPVVCGWSPFLGHTLEVLRRIDVCNQ